MASASNEEGQILENHAITTTVHETLTVNGYHLVDKKQQTLVDPKTSNISLKMTIIIHSRSIDDRSYAVQWNTIEGKEGRIVETEMTQEEVQRFEEDWCTLWNTLAKAD